MKRISIIFLIIICLVSFAGCSKKQENTKEEKKDEKNLQLPAETFELDAAKVIDGYAEITLRSISVTDAVKASMGSNLTYPVDNSENIYVDTVFDIKYLGEKNISPSEFMKATATADSEYVYENVLYCTENGDMTTVSAYDDLTSLSTYRFHVAFEVPKTEKHLVLKFDINGKTYSIDYNTDETIKNVTDILPGGIMENAEYAKMEFVGIEFTDDVVPKNTSGAYNHYQVDSPDNTYLVVRFNVTNYQSTKKRCDSFVGVRAVFGGKYTYTGFAAVERSDGTGFSSYEDIAPRSTANIYYVIELPETVMEMDYEISLLFDKKEYSFQGTGTPAEAPELVAVPDNTETEQAETVSEETEQETAEQ